MTQLNPDDLKALTDITHDLSRAVGGANRDMTFLEKANAATAASSKSNDELQKAIATATKNSISGLTAFSSQLANTSSNDWSALNKAITFSTAIIGKLGSVLANAFLGPIAGPIVGGIFEGVANAAGDVLKFLNGQFAAAYGNFEKLSETGIVSTFEDLKSTAIQTGLNYGDIQQAFGKYSTTLGRFGDSALKGRVEFNKIAYASKSMSSEFQKLGIGIREVTEMQLSYISQRQFSGNMQSMTNEKLLQESKDYILQIDQLSRMTGISRKDLQKQFEDQTRDARYLAGIATKAPEVQKNMKAVIARAGALSPTLAAGLKDFFASGNLKSDESKSAMLAIPGLEQILANLDQGGSADDAMVDITNGLKNFEVENRNTVRQVGDQSIYLRNYVAAVDASTKSEKDLKESAAKTAAQQQEALNGSDKKNDQLAATRRHMYETGVTISILSTSSSLAVGTLSLMSKGLVKVSKALYEFVGKVPRSIELQSTDIDIQEEIRAQQQSIKLNKDKLTATNVGPYEKKLAEQSLKKEEDRLKALEAESLKIRAEIVQSLAAEGRPQVIGSNQSPVSGTPSPNVSNAPMDATDDYSGLNIGGAYPGEAVAGGKASKKVIELARLFQAAYPGGVFNAFNDKGHSGGKHGAGLAFDYSVPEAFKNPSNDATNARGAKFRGPSIESGKKIADFLRSAGASFVLDEYNFPSTWATGGHIHAEVSARVGGIFKGPTTGYRVTLHGEEKVIPLDNEVNDESAAMGSDHEMSEDNALALKEFFETFDSTLNDMIDSLNTQSNTRMIARVIGP
jgi:hypothetical protein